MILMNYISPDWVQHSFRSWVERCHSADSAESVEILKEFVIYWIVDFGNKREEYAIWLHLP
ncbi:hypothetical protein CK203_050407 [Vitis vinifera]|uniref:Uncharacterized protein n=1 Tax=Vitis vinifera TaxID=29760 RepID=A0A438GM64_VITVI|nr:hypothetical protein CK203_050407 [Vitis vinifera]